MDRRLVGPVAPGRALGIVALSDQGNVLARQRFERPGEDVCVREGRARRDPVPPVRPLPVGGLHRGGDRDRGGDSVVGEEIGIARHGESLRGVQWLSRLG